MNIPVNIWKIADGDAVKATGHHLGCDCTECCLVRVESVRYQADNFVQCARRGCTDAAVRDSRCAAHTPEE